MDKSAIKTYAVEARRKLIEAVKLKAQQLYIFEDSAKTLRPGAETDRLQSDGIFLTSGQLMARERLYGELLHEDIPYKPVIYNRVMENVACTWFNRLIALRIMEVNDWLPSNIRILSSREPGRVEPDAMREVERLDYVSQKKVAELRADTSFDASDKLYKYILISQCNALSAILPGMFQKEHDYTELLLPDALLAKGGIVNALVTQIHEDNFNVEKKGQIEIVGWLYQFYISEKKDEVFAGLKKNIKINKDTIPAATQLFTPEWIVKYMVENSLGRLWLDTHPNAELRANWKYYVEEADQEPEVAEQLRVMRSQNPVKHPEDIKLIDPCMGSGHVLVYAFEVLFQIYQSAGYAEREIPNLILQNNLYGLDIDDRAGQLAYFALMIKARSYNRRFFRQESIPQPIVYAIPETKDLEKWTGASIGENEHKAAFNDLKYLVELFSRGKDYGSAIKIEREIDFERLRGYVRDCALGHMIDVAAVLMRKYDVVVTNPPYMGAGGMSNILADYVKVNFADGKSDMFSVFILRMYQMVKRNGFVASITPQSLMFLSTFAALRHKMLMLSYCNSLIDLGVRAFDSGFGVCTACFTVGEPMEKYISTFFDLTASDDKESAFFDAHVNRHNIFRVCPYLFTNLPRNIFAYPYSQKALDLFNKTTINDVVKFMPGVKTGNNLMFVRLWHEVSQSNSAFGLVCKKDLDDSRYKWFKYSQGGGYWKWYGAIDSVVDIGQDAQSIRSKGEKSTYRLRDKDRYFKIGISWPMVGTTRFSSRLLPQSVIPDIASNSLYVDDDNDMLCLLAYMNSKVFNNLMRSVNPTVNYPIDSVASMPYIESTSTEICELTKVCIQLATTDWDSFETSWDFETHPLVCYKNALYVRNPGQEPQSYIRAMFDDWKRETEVRFTTLKTNEEELNRIFIEIYGLQDELTPEVEDKDVTVRRAELGRDVRSFISYAVGCMFGRYSLDEPGLAFAGGKFDMTKYKTYLPEDDNIIPIGSADYFDNDIVVRFVDFVRVVYGDGTLDENLQFITDALYPNGSGSAQERIRRYFLNDFYKDHVKVYQNRPIYWLFDSGKKDGFKALFYLHRYDKHTVARARTDYLHPLQRKYEAEIKRLDMLSGSTGDAREKAAYRKEIDVLQTKIDECRVYDQIMSHIAHQQIELDIDDGVKANYGKFQGVEVPRQLLLFPLFHRFSVQR